MRNMILSDDTEDQTEVIQSRPSPSTIDFFSLSTYEDILHTSLPHIHVNVVFNDTCCMKWDQMVQFVGFRSVI